MGIVSDIRYTREHAECNAAIRNKRKPQQIADYGDSALGLEPLNNKSLRNLVADDDQRRYEERPKLFVCF